jgi:hypothetical protein
MNLRQGWKNILLRHCYKIFSFVTVWSRATRPRFFSGKDLWVTVSHTNQLWTFGPQ